MSITVGIGNMPTSRLEVPCPYLKLPDGHCINRHVKRSMFGLGKRYCVEIGTCKTCEHRPSVGSYGGLNPNSLIDMSASIDIPHVREKAQRLALFVNKKYNGNSASFVVANSTDQVLDQLTVMLSELHPCIRSNLPICPVYAVAPNKKQESDE